MGIGDVAMSLASIRKFAQDLRKLPRVAAIKTASEAAPAITAHAKRSFGASEDPYGTPWAPARDGSKVTLRQTGNLARFIHYVSVGTRLRVALGVPYAKYQIGKRPVFPRQGGALPPEYSRTLAGVVAAVVRRELGQ